MAAKTIPLTQGYVALVSEEDYARVSAFKWYAHRYGSAINTTWYAQRGQRVGRRRLTILMHAFIAGFDRPDHADGDGLNNQRNNLRPATTTQNAMNKRVKSGTSSAFKGVAWERYQSGNGKWRASIKKDGRFIHLGLFKDEVDAATAYNIAAFEHFGEFARFNLPNPSQANHLGDIPESRQKEREPSNTRQ